MVQWLRLCAFTAEGIGSNPGQETKIPHAAKHDPKKKKIKQKSNKQIITFEGGKKDLFS